MLVISFFALGAILLTLQTTILHDLPSWLGRPDLLFLLIVFLAIHLDMFKGAVLVLLFGLLMDIFSGIFLGLYPLIYLLLFFVLKGISRNLALTEPVHQVPLVAISYLLTSTAVFITASVLAPQSGLNWSWGAILLQILILAVISTPCFNFFKWVLSLFDKNKPSSFFLLRPRAGNRFKV